MKPCDALGVCQAKTPRCTGCNWVMAPGAIDGPHKWPARKKLYRFWMQMVNFLRGEK